VSYDSSDFGSIRIKTGGTFDDSGVLFTVKSDVLLSVLNYTGSYYLIANKTNTTTRTLGFESAPHGGRGRGASGEAGQAADEAAIEQLLRDTADPLPIAPGEWQGPRAGLLG
jgi:hypothetical protein